jgi:hypothetical protein
MMRHFGALLAICFGLLLTTVHAQTVYFVMGAGHYSCGQLIAHMGKNPPGGHQTMNTVSGVFVDEYMEYQTWLEGFVSGFNFAHPSDHEHQEQQQVTGIDLAGMDLWMRNWCNKHPTEKVFHGAQVFINEMLTNAARKQ